MPIIPGDISDISRSTSHVEDLPVKSAKLPGPRWTGSVDPGQVEAVDPGRNDCGRPRSELSLRKNEKGCHRHQSTNCVGLLDG